MQPGPHIAPVADLAVDEGVVVHLVEWGDVDIAGERPDLGIHLELGDPGHKLLARLAIGDQVGDRDALELVLVGKSGDLRPAPRGSVPERAAC